MFALCLILSAFIVSAVDCKCDTLEFIQCCRIEDELICDPGLFKFPPNNDVDDLIDLLYFGAYCETEIDWIALKLQLPHLKTIEYTVGACQTCIDKPQVSILGRDVCSSKCPFDQY